MSRASCNRFVRLFAWCYVLVCPRDHQVVNNGAGCTEKHDNGVYRAEVSRWQEMDRCRCVPREKVTEKLCACDEPREVSRCEGGSVLVTDHLRFRREDNICVPESTTARRRISNKPSPVALVCWCLDWVKPACFPGRLWRWGTNRWHLCLWKITRGARKVLWNSDCGVSDSCGLQVCQGITAVQEALLCSTVEDVKGVWRLPS